MAGADVAVKAGGAAGAAIAHAGDGGEVPAGEHLAVEVAGVEGLVVDRFVDAAQVAQREGLGEDVEGERRVVELLAQARARVLGDAAVVEGEWGGSGDGVPGGGADSSPGARRGRLSGEEGVVGDRDGPPARVATGIAEGVELLQEGAPNAGAVGQEAGGGGLERLAGVDDAPRERPRPSKRLSRALYQQQLERAIPQRKADDIYRERNALHVRGHWSPGVCLAPP